MVHATVRVRAAIGRLPRRIPTVAWTIEQQQLREQTLPEGKRERAVLAGVDGLKPRRNRPIPADSRPAGAMAAGSAADRMDGFPPHNRPAGAVAASARKSIGWRSVDCT
jgi:hypothetical protein